MSEQSLYNLLRRTVELEVLPAAQHYGIGLKELWEIKSGKHRPGLVMHTMGWPLRKSGSYGVFGGSFIYPMGEEHVTVGFVAGLEARDVEFSVHDVLQE